MLELMEAYLSNKDIAPEAWVDVMMELVLAALRLFFKGNGVFEVLVFIVREIS